MSEDAPIRVLCVVTGAGRRILARGEMSLASPPERAPETR